MLGPTHTVDVSHRVKTGGFGWTVKYTLSVYPERISIRLGIKLVSAGVTAKELRARRAVWEKEVEALWTGKFEAAFGDRRVPIEVDLDFHATHPQHIVLVRPGRGHADKLNWNIEDPAWVIAHEVGHMLGAYDEYAFGAQHPTSPVADASSVMSNGVTPKGAKPVTPRTHARHLKDVALWLHKSTGEVVEIVPVSPQ
ncbi:MAG: hypothetical protein ACE366_28840 [Bradymonadia bacterium]